MDLSGFLSALQEPSTEELKEDQQARVTEAQFKSVVMAVEKANQELSKHLAKLVEKPDPDFPTSIHTPDVDKVTKAVQDLGRVLKPLENDDSKVITAINEVAKQQKALADLLAKIDFKPQVTVPAPVVTVDAVDLKPLEKAIKDSKPETIDFAPVLKALAESKKASEATTKAIKSLSFPVSSTPTDPLIKYTPADVDDAGLVQYFGFIDNSGGWYIRRFDTSASPKTLRFAFGQGGASAYTTAFAGRAGLTYALWSQ